MNVLSTVVLLPLLLGCGLAFWLGRRAGPAGRLGPALAAGGVTAAALVLLLAEGPGVMAGRTLLFHSDWVPSLGLVLGWRLDGLALLFGLLVTGMGLLVIVYAHFYLGPDDPAGKFYCLLMLFMAAMLGVVLSDNLLLLLVFWELTSLSSFLLVGYWGHQAEARAGARMALAVTGGGGLVMLAGFVLLGQVGGSFELSVLMQRGAQIQAHPQYPLVLGLVLVGCFTKSAQLPFHFWLPQAMAAPTPVSAYLHSATMVKAGVFLLARLYPVLGGSALFETVVGGVGLVTMVFAAAVALRKHDLKGLLAYSTVSHLGLITCLIGLGSPLSAVAAVFHILNHATFKAALFMGAGIVDHETGTRDMRRLGGLARQMPWTAALATLAAASMAGVPLLAGFLSKEMFFAEAVGSRLMGGWGVPLLTTLGGLLSMAYSLRLVHDTFFGAGPRDLPAEAHPHDPPGMLVPVAVLAGLCVLVGVLPALSYGPLVQVAAAAVLGQAPPAYSLSIWHGFNLPLAMSAVALAGGGGLYLLLRRGGRLHAPEVESAWQGKRVFSRLVDGLFGLAGRVTQRVENGSFQRSMAWLLATVLLLAAWPFWLAGEWPGTGSRPQVPAPALAVAVWLLVIGAGLALVLGHHRRFQAVVLVGVIGLATALCFVGLSAPDLALTQLSVEVVSTVLLLMGLALLPQTSPRESAAWRRGRDALLALGAGAGMAGLAWLVMTRPGESISWFFLNKALPEGGGSNVVNVILVDFRGYDTFGEITVLAIAALGALALLDGMRVRRPAADAEGRAWSFAMPPLLLRVAAGTVLPLALVVSLHIFWRGHNLPGGGFIAGLVTAVALVLQYMALGQARADSLLHAAGGRRFVRWIAFGLAAAGLTGVGAWLFGRPFLTSAFGHPVLPWLGELPLATAALFDLGVYATVVGATLLMLSVLGAASKEPPGAVRPATAPSGRGLAAGAAP